MQDSSNGSSEETVHTRIKQMLVSYAFLPGDRLHVPELADQLRVSATPVREALNRLHAEGLLTAVPHRGFFVKRLDQAEIAHLFEMKHLLLTHAAVGPWSDSLGKAEAAMLRRLAPLGNAGGDDEEAVSLYEGHARSMLMLIGALSGNAVLLTWLENVLDRLHFVRQTEVRLPELSQTVLREAGAFASALLARRPDALRTQLKQQNQREQLALSMLMKECISRLYLQRLPQASPPRRSNQRPPVFHA